MIINLDDLIEGTEFAFSWEVEAEFIDHSDYTCIEVEEDHFNIVGPDGLNRVEFREDEEEGFIIWSSCDCKLAPCEHLLAANIGVDRYSWMPSEQEILEAIVERFGKNNDN